MSARVTGTGVTELGAKTTPPCATATTRRATATAAAARPMTIGREPGLATGRRKPNRGCASGAERTSWSARATLTPGSGTASRLEMARASFDTAWNRDSHSAQVSRWRASAPVLASGSSTIRRSVPSFRCATSDLLAQAFLRAPQQCPDLSDTDSERLRDLRVAEPAGSQHEDGGGFRRQTRQRLPHPATVLVELDLLLRIERAVALLDRLRDLAPLPAPRAAQPVQRRVGGRTVEPRRRVLGAGGVQPVEVDEDFLGHVLGFVRVRQHTVGDAHHARVFGGEQSVKRVVVRSDA